MSARRANRRLVAVPDIDDAEQRRQRIERLCVNVARIVALVRNLSDNEDAEFVADFVEDRFPELIELRTGAINKRGQHFGRKSLKTRQYSMLAQARTGFASMRAFRDAFEDFYKHRFNKNGERPTEHPDCWFFEALCLIEEIPALNTLYDNISPGRT